MTEHLDNLGRITREPARLVTHLVSEFELVFDNAFLLMRTWMQSKNVKRMPEKNVKIFCILIFPPIKLDVNSGFMQ